MRKLLVIPRNRDKQAKESYKFFDRLLRIRADEILKDADKMMEDLLLYGLCVMKDGNRIHPRDLFKEPDE